MSSHGCYNRAPYRESYTLHGISSETGQPVVITIPFRMATDCQYTLTELGKTNPKCVGCIHKVTHE